MYFDRVWPGVPLARTHCTLWRLGIVWLTTLFGVALFLPSATADEPSALALLKMAKESRDQSATITIEFEYEGSHSIPVQGIIRQSGNRRVTEIRNKEGDLMERILVDGDAIFKWHQGSDVEGMDLNEASRIGLFCPDVRTFGLDAFYGINRTTESTLLGQLTTCELLAPERLRDVQCEHIHAQNETTFFDIFIDKETSRVHQLSGKSKDTAKGTTVNLYYELESNKGCPWLPSRIEVNNVSGRPYQSTMTIKSYNTAPIKVDVFSLKGMNLPLGVAINDRSSKRRIGYWDGSTIVEAPPVISPR